MPKQRHQAPHEIQVAVKDKAGLDYSFVFYQIFGLSELMMKG